MDWEQLIDSRGQAIIPEGTTEIDDFAFSNSNLKSIDIPEGVQSIGNCAFLNCKELVEVNLPSSLKTIGGAAFALCDNLCSILIPEGVTRIEKEAFNMSGSDFPRLRKVVFPSTLTHIGAMAFKGCSHLSYIDIPASVKTIDDGAFYGTLLAYIKFPPSVKSIGSRAFDYNNIAGFSLSSDNPKDYSPLVNAMTPDEMKNIHIFVPAKLQNLYMNDELFKDFRSVISEEFAIETGFMNYSETLQQYFDE